MLYTKYLYLITSRLCVRLNKIAPFTLWHQEPLQEAKATILQFYGPSFLPYNVSSF